MKKIIALVLTLVVVLSLSAVFAAATSYNIQKAPKKNVLGISKMNVGNRVVEPGQAAVFKPIFKSKKDIDRFKVRGYLYLPDGDVRAYTQGSNNVESGSTISPSLAADIPAGTPCGEGVFMWSVSHDGYGIINDKGFFDIC